MRMRARRTLPAPAMEVAAKGDGGVEASGEKESEKEGSFLLGFPTFKRLRGGRFRCVETGHEMPSRQITERYSRSKGCRLALINYALAAKKPPLNMFKPDPVSKSRLICKLTGDTINKTEEHIWKHISGRRFQNKLKQKEEENNAKKQTTIGVAENNAKEGKKKVKKLAARVAKKNGKQSDSFLASTKKNPKGNSSRDNPMASTPVNDCSESEEPDFWVPPAGSRWDFDNGKDRWESFKSDSESADDVATAPGETDMEGSIISGDLSVRRKLMSIVAGPSSFASRKKKDKDLSTYSKVLLAMASSSIQHSQSLADLEPTSSAEGASKSRKGRGKTRLLKVVGLPPGQKLPLQMNERHQPIGDNSRLLSSYIGLIARNGNIIPLTPGSWDQLPNTVKDDAWKKVMEKFDMPPKLRDHVLQTIGARWRNWKHELRRIWKNFPDWEHQLKAVDGRAITSQYHAMCEYWASDRGKKYSTTNSQNRRMMKCPHTLGTMSFARRIEKERQKNPDGQEPGRVAFYVLSHQRKDGTPVNDTAKEIIDKLQERMAQTSQSPDSPQTLVSEGQIFTEVLGPERHGRVRGYGLGCTPTTLWGRGSSNKQHLQHELEESRVEVKSLKSDLGNLQGVVKQLMQHIGFAPAPKQSTPSVSLIGSRDPQSLEVESNEE